MPLLGQLPFSPSQKSHVPPKKLGREASGKRGVQTCLRLISSIISLGAQSASPVGEVSILRDTADPAGGRSIGANRDRMGRSVAASLASHVVSFSLIALIIALSPEPIYEAIDINRENYNIVWIQEAGLGGGGGGGGNESLELPRMAEDKGPEEAALNVPVEERPDFVEPEVKSEKQPIESHDLKIPAVSMASAVETRPGIFEGLMAASMLSQGSGSDGSAGTGAGGGVGSGQGDGLGPGEGGGVGGGVYRPGAGIQIPRPIREVKPRYTAEAMRARIQGAVWLTAVVLVDGTVGNVSVTKSLDLIFGLDAEAVRAAKQWRFIPGNRFGEPVAVQVVIELTFTLR